MIVGEMSSGMALDPTSAVQEDILAGKTAYDGNGDKLSGVMTINDSQPITTTYGGTYTIPSGYHTGRGTVTGGSFDFDDADAAESDVLSGKKFYNNTGKSDVQTGNMPIYNDSTVYLSINQPYDIELGYHNGEGHIRQSIPIQDAQTIGAFTSEQTLVTSGTYCSGDQKVAAVVINNLTADKIVSGNTVTITSGNNLLANVTGTALHSYHYIGTPTEVRSYNGKNFYCFAVTKSSLGFDPKVIIASQTSEALRRSFWDVQQINSGGFNYVVVFDGGNFWAIPSQNIFTGDTFYWPCGQYGSEEFSLWVSG